MMNYFNAAFMVFLTVQITYSAHTLNLVQDEQALCLDGSRGSFYFDRGSGSGAKSWIIYFQGGGWIGGKSLEATKNDALSRSKTEMGSSKNKAQQVNIGGIFSRDSKINPVLYNWNSIYINYCDGTGHQGYAKDPIIVNGVNLYFRGNSITRSIINQFLNELTQADKVIVSGCSAGGLASFTWVQTIRDLLPQSVTVLNVPDSGVFQDLQTYDGSISYKNTYHTNFMQLSNSELSPPNTRCVQSNPNEQWKCLFAQYLIEYIDTPIFFVQSPYDSWCIPNILKLSCANDGTLLNCNQNQVNFIESHAISMEVMMKSRFSTHYNTGAFGPACLQHCFLESSYYHGTKFQVPSGSGNTIAKTLSSWVLDQSISSNYLDFVSWPDNTGCNNLSIDN
ncbi:unnamed protein product [Paramecium sonneborni]|uniref:Pectin acetylesterase n=1 Tax=Paramecium sonneborni TaxID=65129 RepID=A0A8S1QSJ0_9CILI|nr:unnamed protein product [Paramecium sonneborni]